VATRPDPPPLEEPGSDEPPDQNPTDQNPTDQKNRDDDVRVDLTEPEGAAMTATTMSRPALSAAAFMLLDRCVAGLVQACAARSPAERYVAAHLAALRAAAAVLAVRGRPGARSGPRSVWEVLPRLAPELTEWSAFFAATAARRAAVEAGRGEVVTVREADDLLREAEAFLLVVDGLLGLPQDPVLPDALPSCG
jgi:SAV_6107-like HEPN